MGLFRGPAWVPGEFVVVPQLFDPHVSRHYLVPQVLKQTFFVYIVDTARWQIHRRCFFFASVVGTGGKLAAADVNDASGSFAARIIDNCGVP